MGTLEKGMPFGKKCDQNYKQIFMQEVIKDLQNTICIGQNFISLPGPFQFICFLHIVQEPIKNHNRDVRFLLGQSGAEP